MTNLPLTYDTHFEAFLAFADKQPETRTINHYAGGWCGCAVGDYHREATSIPPRGEEHLVILQDGESPLLNELGQDHGFIFECLNNKCVPESLEETHEINTYLGLANLMRTYKYEPISDEQFDC